MPRFEAPQRVGLPSVVQVRSTTGHWLTVQFGWLVLAVQCVASTASTAHRWGFEQKESEAKGAVRVVQLMFLARRPSREVFAGRLLCQQLQRRRLGEVWWPLPERFRRHTTSTVGAISWLQINKRLWCISCATASIIFMDMSHKFSLVYIYLYRRHPSTCCGYLGRVYYIYCLLSSPTQSR